MIVVTLARKRPPKGMSPAEATARYGTGVWNVGATRVVCKTPVVLDSFVGAPERQPDPASTTMAPIVDRWPSNMVLEARIAAAFEAANPSAVDLFQVVTLEGIPHGDSKE